MFGFRRCEDCGSLIWSWNGKKERCSLCQDDYNEKQAADVWYTKIEDNRKPTGIDNISPSDAMFLVTTCPECGEKYVRREGVKCLHCQGMHYSEGTFGYKDCCKEFKFSKDKDTYTLPTSASRRLSRRRDDEEEVWTTRSTPSVLVFDHDTHEHYGRLENHDYEQAFQGGDSGGGGADASFGSGSSHSSFDSGSSFSSDSGSFSGGDCGGCSCGCD